MGTRSSSVFETACYSFPIIVVEAEVSAVGVTSSSSTASAIVCGGCSAKISPQQSVQICGGACGKKCHTSCIDLGRQCAQCRSPSNKCAQCTEDIPTGVAYKCSLCECSVCSPSCLEVSPSSADGFCRTCLQTKGTEVFRIMSSRIGKGKTTRSLARSPARSSACPLV